MAIYCVSVHVRLVTNKADFDIKWNELSMKTISWVANRLKTWKIKNFKFTWGCSFISNLFSRHLALGRAIGNFEKANIEALYSSPILPGFLLWVLFFIQNCRIFSMKLKHDTIKILFQKCMNFICVISVLIIIVMT